MRRMAEEGFISQEDRARASEAEVKAFGVDDVFRETAPFYVEHARRHVVARYGNERLLHGLRVELAMDLEKQRAAQARCSPGLMEVDHRQGYDGPVACPARSARRSPSGSRAPGRRGSFEVGRVLRRDRGADDRAALAEVEVGETAASSPSWHALGAPPEPGGLLPRRAHRPPVHRGEEDRASCCSAA